jgi:hypothetical protein
LWPHWLVRRKACRRPTADAVARKKIDEACHHVGEIGHVLERIRA